MNIFRPEEDDDIPAKKSKIFSTYLAVLILSSPTSEGYARRQTIRETWLRLHDHGVYYRFVIGGRNLDPKMIRDLKSENDDILILDNLVDTYSNLSAKVLEMFSWVHENADVQYALKVDDDSFVRLDAVCHELTQMEHPRKRFLYWGYMDGRAPVFRRGKWAEKDWILCDRYVPHALGGGYILSRTLVSFLARNKDLFKLYRSEDVSVGAWLAGLDVYYKHDVRFDTEWESRGCKNSYLITHKQSMDEMRKKYNRLEKTGKMCEKEFDVMAAFEYNWTALPSKCCQRNSAL